MDLFANLKEQSKVEDDAHGFAELFKHVEHQMSLEPLLAHLCALNGKPKLIPRYFRKHGVNEESLLFFKWQLSCFHLNIPKPRLSVDPIIFFERNAAEVYWRWLRCIIVTIIRSAPSSSDPRFNPLAVYWSARYIDSLTSEKTVKLVF